MRIALSAATCALALAGVTACSEQTQDDAATAVDRAVADTKANAEVVENAVREGAIDAAEGVSEGADNLREELVEDEMTDPHQGDGQLDGTD